MRLTPPRQITFAISVIAIVVAILQHLGIIQIDPLAEYTFWLAAGGGVLLALGALLRGL